MSAETNVTAAGETLLASANQEHYKFPPQDNEKLFIFHGHVNHKKIRFHGRDLNGNEICC